MLSYVRDVRMPLLMNRTSAQVGVLGCYFMAGEAEPLVFGREEGVL